MKLISRRTYPLLSLAIYSALASAAPPSTSAYYTDPTSSNVQDATSNSIGQVNMITCIMHAMRPEALVNKPSYNALVDQTKCDQEKRASSGTQVASYMTATVTATRASNTDPMLSKIWIDNDDEKGKSVIFVHISATAAPTATSPYGSFRLDFCGKGDGDTSCMMNGYMEGTSNGLRYFETESQQDQQGNPELRTTALQLNTSGSTSGTGQLSVVGGEGAGTFTFAYNASLFLRYDGTNSECFSRDASDPDTGFSVWRYGLYDATTGVRVDRNSGFAIEYTSGGTTYQGFLGYGGLSLPGSALNTMQSGATVQKVDYSAGGPPVKTDYTVVKAGGKLTKYTKNVKKLNQIDKIKFYTFLGNDASTYFYGAEANSQYEIYWSESDQAFRVSGRQNCSQNGCQSEDFAFDSQPVVAASKWSALGGVQGNSPSLGGELFIDLTGVSGAVTSSSVNVVYRTQDLVYPSQMAQIAALYCVRDCPTSASISTFLSTPPQQQGQGPQQGGPQQMPTPYVAATANNWQPTPLASVVTYHLDSTTALLKDDANTALTMTDADALSQFPQFMNGIRTGRLVASLDSAKCASDPTQYCDAQINDVDVYYQWETGPSSFNQFAAVKDSSGTFVQFDAPLLVNFTVPSSVATYHQYAGTSLVLQYGGYGDLWGIPGYCVTTDTNTIVPCTQNVRYVPSFQIPFDATTGKVTSGDNTYLVKWLDREIRFAHKDASVCAAANLTVPNSVALPTASDLKDPGNPNADIYIGVRPVVTEAPRVIHGDVKF